MRRFHQSDARQINCACPGYVTWTVAPPSGHQGSNFRSLECENWGFITLFPGSDVRGQLNDFHSKAGLVYALGEFSTILSFDVAFFDLIASAWNMTTIHN